MNKQYKPMLAKTSPNPFSDDNWIFEIKWDGFRAIAYVNKELIILSRNEKELQKKFPELNELLELTQNVVLDGEIIVMKKGKPDFHALLERSKATNSIDINIQSKKLPVSYVIFDILEKNGKNLTDLPLIERKKILKETVKEGNHIFLSDVIEKRGLEYYKIVTEKGLEGIIAKKKTSSYETGGRSNNWLKIKEIKSVDCVVFGYTTGSGSRQDSFGALLLGVYNEKKEPIYIGKVGTGFSQNSLLALSKIFRDITSKNPPFKVQEIKTVNWLKPKIVCEVFYQSITKEGKLRMPRFHGVKNDKKPLECTIKQIEQPNLDPYFSKRDFNKTKEPIGGKKKGKDTIFVVQEHHSRRLHYDLRLEKEGVLKSWAVPKGIPIDQNKKRLAVEVEDHPFEYSKFEGTIPEGQYGAGTVKIWDKGIYELKEWENDLIEFFPKGKKMNGKYVLVRLKKDNQKNWLLFKGRD